MFAYGIAKYFSKKNCPDGRLSQGPPVFCPNAFLTEVTWQYLWDKGCWDPYLVVLNCLSLKINWRTNKSEVKYPSTLANLAQWGRRQRRTQDMPGSVPLEITFLLNLFCSFLHKPLRPTLPSLYNYGKTRLSIKTCV